MAKPDKKFIKKAIKKPGQLHKDLGVPKGEKIPQEKLEAAAQKGGKVGQRARFAETLEKMPHAQKAAKPKAKVKSAARAASKAYKAY